MEKKKTDGTSGKAVILTMLPIAYALQLAFGFEAGYVDNSIIDHLTFPLFHANVFHVAGNILVLSLLHFSVRDLITAYFICFTASFLSVTEYPTMGFSGILYVIVGIYTTVFLGKFTMQKAWFIAFLAIGVFVGRFNGLLHILCFAGGLAVRYIRRTVYDYKKAGR